MLKAHHTLQKNPCAFTQKKTQGKPKKQGTEGQGSGSHRSTRIGGIASDLESRALAPNRRHVASLDLKNMPIFASQANIAIAGFSQRFFWNFPVISDQANLGGNFGPEKKYLAPRPNSPQTPSQPLAPPAPTRRGPPPLGFVHEKSSPLPLPAPWAPLSPPPSRKK